MKYQLQKQLCSFENEKLISFSYKIWLMISEKKKKSQVHISSPCCMHAPKVATRHTQNFFIPYIIFVWTSDFIDMNTYILTEGSRSFKTFLTENYAFALDSCYLFTKKY